MPDHNELPHTFKIYIPTECVCGELLPEIERNEVLDEVKTTLSGWFGGATTSRVEGSWEHTDGRLAKEPVDVVTSYATREAAEEHHEEFTELVADLANRLTQDAVLCEVNAKGNVYSATALPEPHRCMGGGTRGSLPVPRQASEKQRQFQLEAALQQLTDVRDARDLFCNVLHYEFEDEQLATVKWPDQLKACLAPGTAPRIIADQNGFKILYLQLAEDYLRKGHERQLVQRIIKDDPTLRGLVVVSDVDQKEWNLVNAKFEKEEGKRERLRLRRMRVGPGQSVRTAVERLGRVDVETAGEDVTAAQLQDLHDEAFDVESVSKEFFNEISNWYFWALSQVEFPEDTLKDGDDEKHRATSLIRFLTRIIFCWFLKEKNLIPTGLFNEKELADILVDLEDDSCTYHQGILQNLFFATLNQRMGKDGKGNPYRAFAKDEGFPKNKSTYGVDTLYRYEEHFREPDKALSHFADIPFLNGGLFECLDRTEEGTNKKLYVDGFSRNRKKRARVPNHLFFAGDQTVDLSEAYGDTGRRNARVRGLLRILHAYNFTVEENTPIDEEIALDPELLGKVFENLLASYNEETKTTARKQTGSFYTPRPIVEYMVDESLRAHLCGTLTKLGREEEDARDLLDLLLGYTEDEPSFSEEETNALLATIHTCKILDPACGSGAFPIGMLQKLVHILHKLDPENARWKQLQIDEASKIPDASARNVAVKAIERDFEENGDDYGRKLYLIENCLYGVDIQPIAIQISKLRFFISLICDQKTNRNKAKNHGIRALPNLETKFVAADTLIRFHKKIQTEIFDSPNIEKIEEDLQRVRHDHFSVQTRRDKLALQAMDKKLREQLNMELNQSTFADQSVSHKLASWDPYDSNSSASFFEPLWMFDRSLSNGFHIIIGNPPYISIENFAGQDEQQIWANSYSTFAPRGDVYCLFYERGAELLSEGGTLVYITSNKWMRASYGGKLRDLFSTNLFVTKVLDFGMGQNFSAATTYTCITQLSKTCPTDDKETMACYAKDPPQAFSNPAAYFEENAVPLQHSGSSEWVVMTPMHRTTVKGVESIGIPLKDWDIKISSGIKTSHNKAFIINQQTYDELVEKHSSSTDILHPILRGEDIKRYHPSWKNYYVIGTFKQLRDSYRIEDYPAIMDHLSTFRSELEPRPTNWNPKKDGKWKGRNTQPFDYLWYEVFFSPDLAEFRQEKIMYPNMTKFLPFYLDHSDHWFCNQKGFIITGCKQSLGYLTAFLNSSLFRYCFRDNFPELLGNTYELSKKYFKEICVYRPTNQKAETFSALVSLVQLAKSLEANFAEILLTDIIDACVMECYFRDHMKERNLLIFDDLATHLDGYDPDAGETKQREFLDYFDSKVTAEGSVIRSRFDRICKDSPDLLAVIKQEGKV